MRYLLGMGNYAMGDDSIGLRLIEHIADHHLDEDFQAVEIGNNGLQMLTYFTEETELLVIADAVSFGGKPGDWTVFSPDEVTTRKFVGGLTTHEGDVLKLIELGRSVGQPIPPIRIVAIEPASMKLDSELSPILAERFEDYLQTALREIRAAPSAAQPPP